MADGLVARLGQPNFRRLLDVGGASGTWTLAFLRAGPAPRPHLRPARRHRAGPRAAGRERLETASTLVAGDFYSDELPAGADLAWVSAIAHQHSREHNRALVRQGLWALQPGGRIAIRDIVMEPDRVAAGRRGPVRRQHAGEHRERRHFHLRGVRRRPAAAGFVEPKLLVKARRADGDEFGGHSPEAVSSTTPLSLWERGRG